MGIVKKVLADFETESGQAYRIELNESGKIHIHTDHVRIDLTRDEFIDIAHSISAGHESLKEIKNEL
jgi:hypothetical protein